jgi:hypothetical protein
MYEIIKNCPLPSKCEARTMGYPFAGMDIGDGFEAPDDLEAGKRQSNIASCASSWRKNHNPTAKFATRKIKRPDGDVILCVRTA